MPELPHIQGLPSYHDLEYWGPFFQAASELQVVMCLHIGQGFGAITAHPDAPIDNMIILSNQVSSFAAQDLLWGGGVPCLPRPEDRLVRGRDRLDPFYLDRCDRHYTNQRWLGHDFGGKLPSDIFREHSLACYVTDPTALKVRHDIGIDIIAWECDYPHSDSIWPNAPEFVHAEMGGADVPRRGHGEDPLAEHLPVLRLGPVQAHRQGRRHGRRPARAEPGRGHHHPLQARVAAAVQRAGPSAGDLRLTSHR